jgi:hypothetical protein
VLVAEWHELLALQHVKMLARGKVWQLEEDSKVDGRLDTPDELQIRLLLRVPPARRLQTMLEMQDALLTIWRERFRKAHPELSDLELCRLLFARLEQNG